MPVDNNANQSVINTTAATLDASYMKRQRTEMEVDFDDIDENGANET
jgi:hypothetical protein